MIGRPSRHRRLDPLKAQLANIQCIDEGIDHANRIALVNPVIEAFRQQCRLRPIRPYASLRLIGKAEGPQKADRIAAAQRVPSLVWWKLVDSALRQFSTLEDHAARSIG